MSEAEQSSQTKAGTEAVATPSSGSMRSFKWLSTFEGALIALIPAGAVLVAYLYQTGAYLSVGIPFELVELSTPKIIISIIATVFFFWFYVAIWADTFSTKQPRTWYGALLWHVFVNAVMTGVFWFRPRADFTSNLLTMIFCVLLFTTGTLWFQKLNRSRAAERQVSLVGYSMFAAYAIAVVFFASVVSGFNSEAKRTSRLVLKGSNQAFIGTYNGQYIFKKFDAETSTFSPDDVVLMVPDDSIILERREISLKSRDGR